MTLRLMTMNSARKVAEQLQVWAKTKRRLGLNDAQVQMARELRIDPRRLTESAAAAAGPGPDIEALYLKRFRKPRPDSIVPLRQLLHEARAQVRIEAHERRRRKRQAERDHAKAARVSLLTLRRLCGAEGLSYAIGGYDDLTECDEEGRPDA